MPTFRRRLHQLQHSSSEPNEDALATLDCVLSKRLQASLLPEPGSSVESLSFPGVPGSAVASPPPGTGSAVHPRNLPPAA
jgi:hypothetical protein